MNIRLKKALYESIMRNVSKQVRKALNESGMSDIEYLISELKSFPIEIETMIQGHEDVYTIELLDNIDDIDFDDPDTCIRFKAVDGDYEVEFDVDLYVFIESPSTIESVIEDQLEEAVEDDYTSFATRGEPFWPEEEEDYDDGEEDDDDDEEEY